jgi:hypothetical protein
MKKFLRAIVIITLIVLVYVGFHAAFLGWGPSSPRQPQLSERTQRLIEGSEKYCATETYSRSAYQACLEKFWANVKGPKY